MFAESFNFVLKDKSGKNILVDPECFCSEIYQIENITHVLIGSVRTNYLTKNSLTIRWPFHG